jgi:hypothetical protein
MLNSIYILDNYKVKSILLVEDCYAFYDLEKPNVEVSLYKNHYSYSALQRTKYSDLKA